MGDICSKCFSYVTVVERRAFEPGKHDVKKTRTEGEVNVLAMRKYEETNQGFQELSNKHNADGQDQSKELSDCVKQQREDEKKFQVGPKRSQEEVIIILSNPEGEEIWEKTEEERIEFEGSRGIIESARNQIGAEEINAEKGENKSAKRDRKIEFDEDNGAEEINAEKGENKSAKRDRKIEFDEEIGAEEINAAKGENKSAKRDRKIEFDEEIGAEEINAAKGENKSAKRDRKIEFDEDNGAEEINAEKGENKSAKRDMKIEFDEGNGAEEINAEKGENKSAKRDMKIEFDEGNGAEEINAEKGENKSAKRDMKIEFDEGNGAEEINAEKGENKSAKRDRKIEFDEEIGAEEINAAKGENKSAKRDRKIEFDEEIGAEEINAAKGENKSAKRDMKIECYEEIGAEEGQKETEVVKIQLENEDQNVPRGKETGMILLQIKSINPESGPLDFSLPNKTALSALSDLYVKMIMETAIRTASRILSIMEKRKNSDGPVSLNHALVEPETIAANKRIDTYAANIAKEIIRTSLQKTAMMHKKPEHGFSFSDDPMEPASAPVSTIDTASGSHGHAPWSSDYVSDIASSKATADNELIGPMRCQELPIGSREQITGICLTATSKVLEENEEKHRMISADCLATDHLHMQNRASFVTNNPERYNGVKNGINKPVSQEEIASEFHAHEARIVEFLIRKAITDAISETNDLFLSRAVNGNTLETSRHHFAGAALPTIGISQEPWYNETYVGQAVSINATNDFERGVRERIHSPSDGKITNKTKVGSYKVWKQTDTKKQMVSALQKAQINTYCDSISSSIIASALASA